MGPIQDEVVGPEVIGTRVRESINFPKFVPYSMRHKMTTALRTKQVPEDQIAVLLGHRRPMLRTTQTYREHDPSYLRGAANAIDDYLWEMNKRTDRDLFAPVCCKTVASGNVLQFTNKGASA